MFQDVRKACAGLTDVLVDVDRREDRLDPAFGIRVGRDIRIDLALEFRLIGLMTSSGERMGDMVRSIGLPSGIVLGGDTVILLVRLPVLLSSPFVSVGDAIISLLGIIVDTGASDVFGRAGGLLPVAIPRCSGISV